MTSLFLQQFMYYMGLKNFFLKIFSPSVVYLNLVTHPTWSTYVCAIFEVETIFDGLEAK